MSGTFRFSTLLIGSLIEAFPTLRRLTYVCQRFSTLQIGSLIEATLNTKIDKNQQKFQYPSNRVVDRS